LLHVFRDKKKEFAPSGAAFYPLGADLFLSPRKIDHIARYVQIPAINVPGDVPSILVVNIQVISYFLVHIKFELGISDPYMSSYLLTILYLMHWKL